MSSMKNMFKKNIINALLILVIICSSCQNNNLNDKFRDKISENFLDLANSKKVDLSTIVDDYENVEYVKYVHLNKYYVNGKLVDKAFLYEGDIECYDKDDNLIRKDENVYRILLTENGGLSNEGITSDGYLSNKFGMLNLEEGFYKSDEYYYYVSGETHKVVDCSNATNSNAIRKITRQIISKNGEKYIVYTDEEKNGELVKNQISNILGEIYLTDEDGKVVSKSGLYEVSNVYDNTLHLIYEGLDGKIKKNKEAKFNCYVNENGKVLVGDRIEINEKKYFADFDGRLKEDEYLWDIGYSDEDKLNDLIDGEKVGDKSYIKYILYNINKKDIDINNISKNKDNDEEYIFCIMKKGGTVISTVSEIKTATNSETTTSNERDLENGFIDLLDMMLMDTIQSDRNVYVRDKNNDLVKNRIVHYGDRMYYVGNDSIIEKNKIVNIDNKEVLIDTRGDIVRDTWLFDKKYYDDEKLASREVPYIKNFKVDRNIVKPFLGYYVLSDGEILKDDIYIESAIFDEYGEAIEVFRVKNGEYDGTYDKDLFLLNTYKDGEEEYNYEEYDEGLFSYVHRYTDKDRRVKIDDNNIDEQLKYRCKLADVKFLNKDTVFFGRYPNHDVTGEISEPIEWVILRKNSNEALLMTKNMIDAKMFDENGSNDWENSSLNNWLNNEFIDMAFMEEEKNRIIYKIGLGKIFLLDKSSYDMYEKEAGMFSLLSSYTNFSIRNVDDSMDRFIMNNWLRSKEVDELKGVDTEWLGTGFSSDPKEIGGVRPVIYIKINEPEE